MAKIPVKQLDPSVVVTPMTQQLDANNLKIVNLATPTNPNDAARLADVGAPSIARTFLFMGT